MARTRLVVHLTAQIRGCLDALNDQVVWRRLNDPSNAINDFEAGTGPCEANTLSWVELAKVGSHRRNVIRKLVFAGTLLVGWVALTVTVPMAGSAFGQQLPESVDVPQGDADLGTVSLPRRVLANGEALSAGDYSVRLTAQVASPTTVGALAMLERWVEFKQGDEVRGREVVSIVPSSEIADVAKSNGPAVGAARVELLRENEYMRMWINHSGTHYLIHLVVG